MSHETTATAQVSSAQTGPSNLPGKVFVLPAKSVVLYILTATCLSWTQGLGMYMVQANIQQIQGYFHTTAVETTWLVAAYMAPYASMTILLAKIRTEFGLRNFATVAIICFILVCLMHIFVTDYNTALVVRFLGGITAAPLSSLAFLYMIQPFAPNKKITAGVSLNLINVSLAMPLSRLIAPFLLDIGDFPQLYHMEIGMALICLALLHFLPLTPIPRAKVIGRLDLISYFFIAIGLGLNAAIMPLGRFYWWREANWMGICFAIALCSLVIAALIELNRKNPLIDLRWLFSREMLHIAIVMLIFRIVLSEQSTLAANYFNLFGLLNEQIFTLYLFVIGGILIGGLTCAFFFKPGHEDAYHVAALIFLIMGSWLDSHSTNMTRPVDMYFSQGMIGIGTGLFLPPSMSRGLRAAFARGPNYTLSFIAVFLFTQSTGGLMGSAFFSSLQIIFEKFHSSMLSQHIVLSDPIVANRVAVLSAPYKPILTDPGLLQAEGLAALGKKATLEANILAYNDVFRIYCYVALALLIFLLIRMARDAYLKYAASASSAPAPA